MLPRGARAGYLVCWWGKVHDVTGWVGTGRYGGDVWTCGSTIWAMITKVWCVCVAMCGVRGGVGGTTWRGVSGAPRGASGQSGWGAHCIPMYIQK